MGRPHVEMMDNIPGFLSGEQLMSEVWCEPWVGSFTCSRFCRYLRMSKFALRECLKWWVRQAMMAWNGTWISEMTPFLFIVMSHPITSRMNWTLFCWLPHVLKGNVYKAEYQLSSCKISGTWHQWKFTSVSLSFWWLRYLTKEALSH